MLLRGGAGGGLDLAAVMEGVELDEVLAAGFRTFGVTVGLMLDDGRGCAAGLRTPDFWRGLLLNNKTDWEKERLTWGPPALSNLPCVIGRATPGFLFGIGRDRLAGDSPEGT